MRHIRHERQFDTITLSCDVGGTNISVGAVGRVGRHFELLGQRRFATKEQDGLLPPLREAIGGFSELSEGFDYCCISGAGPVYGNRCHLSNVPWEIDGEALGRQLSLPTKIINDFAAISYGVPLLNVQDPEQITPIPHPEGPIAPNADDRRRLYAVLGAGTGLGVGYLVGGEGYLEAFPSEGGHALFGPFDELSREFHGFLTERRGELLGSELFVSGQGIANAVSFFRETGRLSDSAVKSLEKAGSNALPAKVAELAESDESCAEIMRLFVRMYAKVAANVTLTFLPTQGLYLAGGITSKNQRWLLEEHRFMRAFEAVYKDSLVDTLKNTPVYIVNDYAISLYGAAHAAYWLLDHHWRRRA
ncbi:MAG: glucokinase [Alkalispirochaetaceae bacterium]